MSDLTTVSVNITIVAAAKPRPKKDSGAKADQLPCDLWSECNDPLCFRAGCRNDVFSPKKGEKS